MLHPGPPAKRLRSENKHKQPEKAEIGNAFIGKGTKKR
jgi:hypothetical protein